MKKIKLNIQINYPNKNIIPKKKKIKTWIMSVIKKTCEITIRIVDTDEMKKLNFLYRKKKTSTNILSFPFEKPKYIKSILLGDLVICAKKIEQESILQNKILEMHWAHIIIHGTLHLLGYQHNNKIQSQIMEKIEIKKMIHFGYHHPYFM